MNIAIDISQIVYQGTGVAAYKRNLVGSLLKLDTFNHFVLFGSTLRREEDLLDFCNELPHQSSLTTKIYNFPPTLLHVLWNKLHILPMEKFVGKVDVVHTSDWVEPPAKAPKVTTIHDLVVYKCPQNLPQKIIATQKAKLAWVKKESSLIIADSAATKNDLVELLGISQQKIKVIHLGVATNYFPQSESRIRAVRRKYEIEGPYLLTVGTREPRKNITRVVAAYNKLKPKATLVIAGNYGWGQDVEVAKGIKVTGYIPEAELPTLYSGASGFVYPSLYEGFGLPVLEAMACGAPVVTSNRGSLKEIVGKDALVINPESDTEVAEAIESMLSLGKSQRDKLSKLGILHASKFTWEKTARETLKVYQEVVG